MPSEPSRPEGIFSGARAVSWPEGFGWWIALAIALFWFVGAYNRLVRLRAAALQAYATLDAALVRQLDFVQTRATAPGADPALLAAIDQLTTLLAATRPRPLEPAGIAALATALRVLLAAWQRLHPDEVTSFDAEGMLSRPMPLEGGERPEPASAAAPMAWPEPSAAAEIARGQFNLAAERYNAAIAQFPAVLVAWAFRLRPAAPLA